MNKCCEVLIVVFVIGIGAVTYRVLRELGGEKMPYIVLAAAMCFSVAFACIYYMLVFVCNLTNAAINRRNEEAKKPFERSSEAYWKLHEGDNEINLERSNVHDSPYPWSLGFAWEQIYVTNTQINFQNDFGKPVMTL